MNEDKAKKIAAIVGGETYQSGGDIWLVIIRKHEGIAVISDESVCSYRSEDAFLQGDPPVDSVIWADG